jgi:hypothetical protein
MQDERDSGATLPPEEKKEFRIGNQRWVIVDTTTDPAESVQSIPSLTPTNEKASTVVDASLSDAVPEGALEIVSTTIMSPEETDIARQLTANAFKGVNVSRDSLFKEPPLLNPPIVEVLSTNILRGLTSQAVVVRDASGSVFIVKRDALPATEQEKSIKEEQVASEVYGKNFVASRTILTDGGYTQESLTPFKSLQEKERPFKFSPQMTTSFADQQNRGKIPPELQEVLVANREAYKMFAFAMLWGFMQGYVPDLQFIQGSDIIGCVLINNNVGVTEQRSSKIFDFDAAHLDLMSLSAHQEFTQILRELLVAEVLPFESDESGNIVMAPVIKKLLKETLTKMGEYKHENIIHDRLNAVKNMGYSEGRNDEREKMIFSLVEGKHIYFQNGARSRTLDLAMYHQAIMTLIQEIKKLEAQTNPDLSIVEYLNAGIRDFANGFSQE